MDRFRARLAVEGFAVQCFFDAQGLFARVEEEAPDLVLASGDCIRQGAAELCMHLREMTDAVIILHGGNLSELDVIGALSVGADVCVPERISMSVLIAQIRACFRRAKLADSGPDAAGECLVDMPGLSINSKSRAVTVAGEAVTLTAREFDILALLASRPNQVFDSERIFRGVWGAEGNYYGDTRTVSVHISNLRRKIEQDPERPERIITVHGAGYKFQV